MDMENETLVGAYSREFMRSSATDEWETDQDFFDKINNVFKFDLDVCALDSSAKCDDYYTPETDGLSQDWGRKICWMNPPYGDPEMPCKDPKKCTKKKCIRRGYCNDKYIPGIADWLKKAHESARNGATVVCLVPARTSTVWWHNYCEKKEKLFIKGRLTFGTAINPAPFPSALVIMRPTLAACFE